MTGREQTLVLLKPDALEQGLSGAIFSRFDQEGLETVKMKTVQPDEELLAQHYAEHTEKDFYDPLIEFMTSGSVIAAILEGENAATTTRELAGDTEPVSADPGTIRGDFSNDSYEKADNEGRAVHNVIHASEPGAAQDEIALWFPGEDGD